MSPGASGPHLGTEQAQVPAGFGVSKGPRACLMTGAGETPAAPARQADAGVHVCTVV